MAAPPAEGKSKTGKFMIIDVQVQGSEKDDLDYKPKDDQELFKDQCIIEIPQTWLTGEFFEAQIERWNFGESNQTRLTLFLPGGCVALEGARLLKLRLGSDYVAQQERPTPSKEERAWSPVDWCKAAGARLPSLFGALHLFHFTMQKDFALEVAETLKLYRVRCPPWVVTIAQALKVAVKEVKPPAAKSSDVPFETFKSLLKHAMENDSTDHGRILVEKVIAGNDWPPDDVMDALVCAWFHFFEWKTKYQEVLVGEEPTTQIIGRPIRANKSIPWLLRLVEELVQEHPSTACTCHTALLSGLAETFAGFEVWRWDPNTGECSTQRHFANLNKRPADKLRATCAHSLFFRSSLDWPGTKHALAEFTKLSCNTTMYKLSDCQVTADPFIKPALFATAHPQAQEMWLRASPAEFLTVFKDHAHVVDPSVRRYLLKDLSVLSDKDVEFLTQASLFDTDNSAADRGHASLTKRQRRS